MAIIPLLKPAWYGKGDVVFSPKMEVREMAFLVDGICDCTDAQTSALIARYRSGDHFGEHQILVESHVSFALKVEVRTVSVAQILLLTRRSYFYLMATFPSLAKVFERSIREDSVQDVWLATSHL